MNRNTTGNQLSLFDLPTNFGGKNKIDAKARRLKVIYGYYQASGKPYNIIRLAGHWLTKAGFVRGDTVEVLLAKPGQLIITKITDATETNLPPPYINTKQNYGKHEHNKRL